MAGTSAGDCRRERNRVTARGAVLSALVAFTVFVAIYLASGSYAWPVGLGMAAFMGAVVLGAQSLRMVSNR